MLVCPRVPPPQISWFIIRFPDLGTMWLLKSNTGWWYTYPSEKYESQLGWLFPIYGKIKFMFQTTNQNMIAYIPLMSPKKYHDIDIMLCHIISYTLICQIRLYYNILHYIRLYYIISNYILYITLNICNNRTFLVNISNWFSQWCTQSIGNSFLTQGHGPLREGWRSQWWRLNIGG